jgi:hypothetical protein
MHTRSAVAGAAATLVAGAGLFFAVAASNADEIEAAQTAPLVGHYSTVESVDFVEYVPEPEPLPEPVTPEPEPVVEEPVVVAPEPVVEQPAPQSEPVPAPVETPPTNLDLGPPPEWNPPAPVEP